jgi:signal transduction histidine kinase
MDLLRYVAEALQMFNNGLEKGDVVCHLLKGLLLSVDENLVRDVVVVYLEKHRNDNDRYFVHQLSLQPPNVVHYNAALLINEKKVDLISSLSYHTGHNGLSGANGSKDEEVNLNNNNNNGTGVNVVSPNKKANKKWSLFHSKKGTTQQLTPVGHFHADVSLEGLHRVYDGNGSVIEKLKQFLEIECPGSSNGKNGWLKLHPKHAFESISMQHLMHVANAISAINSLYKKRHKSSSNHLKERIFNEIVYTLDMPLLVFDVQDNNEEEAENGKKLYHFRCTYYNESFKQLVERKGCIGAESLLLESSPQDQRYEDDKHSIFFKFLRHPTINEAIEKVLRQRPLARSRSNPIVRSSSGSLDNEPTPMVSTLSSTQSTTLLERKEQKKVSETIEMHYSDDVFPESHYEFHIYRVNGTRIGLVIRDVSERVHHLQLIEQASKAKTEFLANMNHEFRTPLNSIDGNLQLLNLTLPLTERQKELINRMRLAGTALMSLLQEVLDYAKLEQKKYVLNKENFSLRLCIQESIDVMAAPALNKKNKIAHHIALDVPTVVYGDSWQLQKVLVNLLSNAIRFTENGIIQINVSVTPGQTQGAVVAQSSANVKSNENGQILDDQEKNWQGKTWQGDMIRFDVIDTGCGIDEETQKDLFKPWVQASNNNRGGLQGGTGLGLAICKELCSLMGGQIWLQSSQINYGSQFSFTLPLVSAETFDQLQLLTKEMDLLRGKRVLLLHPPDDVRKKLTRSILSWGMLLTVASDTDEAQQFFEAGYVFDVAFLGILEGSCDKPATETSANILSLVKWIDSRTRQAQSADKRGPLPIIAIGDDQSEMDLSCVNAFRKVIQSPLLPEDVFHICVNLFSDHTLKKPSKNNSALQSQKHHHAQQQQPSQLRSKSCRCLIVEDVEENKQVLEEMLQHLGHYDCVSVENGQEMLQLLLDTDVERSDKDKFDVIFIDLLMPVMNGIDAVKILRKTHPMNTRPYVVAVTATTLISSENDQHKSAGMDAFLQKPIKLNELKTLMDVIARK